MNNEINPKARFETEPVPNLIHFPWGGARVWAMIGLLTSGALIVEPTPAAVTEAWVQRYNGVATTTNYNGGGVAVAVDGSGDVVMTGISEGSSGAGTYDYYTAKYAGSNGALLWEKRYNGPANGMDVVRAMALDGNGNALVTGYSYNNSGNFDYYTAKYASANGALLWEKRYDGPANGDDIAAALVVDAAGNVVVTGTSDSSDTKDSYTAKYAALTGAILWEKRYSGQGQNPDMVAEAVDGNGNVVVTGIYRGSGNLDYYTAKYAAATGATLWETHYGGQVNGPEKVAVAVDAGGNVVITGYSAGLGGNYHVVKYAGMDGALLWERRSSSSANSGISALALDGSGNAVVTGYSPNSSGTYDYYTSKYAAADGQLLWEQRYNGPENGYDAANAIAIGASGSVYITGYVAGSGGYDYGTIKYDPKGNQIWVAGYNAPNPQIFSDDASAIALDSAENVYVTGFSGGDFATIKYLQTDVPGFPTITVEPQTQTVLASTNVTFSVVADGNGPLSYEWHFNGFTMAGATNSTLLFSNVQAAQAGEYSVQVGNSLGFIVSPLARLAVLTPPSITSEPYDTNGLAVLAGESATFVVGATGSSPLSYQWLFNGQTISGATNYTLFLPNVRPEQAGIYSVVITNAYGSTNSVGAPLIVQPVAIQGQPQSQTSIAGDSVTLNVYALGHFPLSYQWQFNGHNIDGATNNYFSLTTFLATNAGDYTVVITNSFGSVTSAVARLRIDSLRITIQPQNQSLRAGQRYAQFTAQPNTYSTLTYQWQHDGTNLPGAVYQTLTILNLQLTDSGDYTAFATNALGAMASAVAHLTVTTPGPLDSWNLVRGSPGPSLSGSTFGNGLFVAVNDAGAIFSSTNTTNWTGRSTPTENRLSAVCYGDGTFVAVGDEGTILTSTNALTWVRRPSGTTVPLQGATYGNGTFVVIGDQTSGHDYSLILTSKDGINWNAPLNFGYDRLSGLTYANGIFVAVGYDDSENHENPYSEGVILSSSDATNWIQRYSGTTLPLLGVTYGNGIFVTVGVAGAVVISGDGITWTNQSAGSTLLNTISYGNGRFSAAGFNSIFTSEDGIVWSNRYNAANNLNSIVYGNGTFLVVGDEIATSGDGLTWQSMPPSPNLHSVAAGHGILAAVGIGTILTSRDGVNWTDRSAGNGNNTFNEVIFANNLFLAVGNSGAILTSADGVSWTTRGSGNLNELHGVVHAKGGFVTVGRKGTVLTSTDGITWTARNSGTTSYLKAVAYGDGLFVAVGNLSSNVLTSADGINWIPHSIPVPNYLTELNFEDVAYGNSGFVAIGDDSYIATSPNGLVWSISNTSVGKNLRGITYDSGTFVVVANDGRVLTSSDGQEWAIRDSAAGNNLRDVAYFNGRFVAVGNDGTIVQSGPLLPWLEARGFTEEGFELKVQAPPGIHYVIQGSTDLRSWTDLFNFSNSDDTTLYIDFDAVDSPHRFYRVSSP